MKIRYLEVAGEEVREAADYYTAISPGLGVAFGHQHRRPGYWRERLAGLR